MSRIDVPSWRDQERKLEAGREGLYVKTLISVELIFLGREL